MPSTFLDNITEHYCHSRCHVIIVVTVTRSRLGDVHCVPAEGRLRALCVVGPGPGSSAHPMCPHPTVLSSHYPRHSSCPGPGHPLISKPSHELTPARPPACCQICHTQMGSKYLRVSIRKQFRIRNSIYRVLKKNCDCRLTGCRVGGVTSALSLFLSLNNL